MSSSKRTLKTLTVEKKKELIEEVRKAELNKSSIRKKDTPAKYGIAPNTLSTIMKNKEQILKSPEASKKRRDPEFPDVEQCLMDWLKECRKNNVSIGNLMIPELKNSLR